MHKFLRSIGFSLYKNDWDIDRLLKRCVKEASQVKRIQIGEDANYCEIRAEVAPDMGIAILGSMDPDGKFYKDYYYPYLTSHDVSSQEECSIQRHTERETYAGLLDDFKVGSSLIFYINNSLECRERILDKNPLETESVSLTGLATSGKILLPIQKTEQQRAISKVAARNRNSLLEAAKNGDEDAMETLTIEDIDLYSRISKRLDREDIYTIIESCFMPSGIECDLYSIIGEIQKMDLKENRVTGEKVYDFTLDCNDMKFHVGVAKTDLLGEPKVGRRFKGQVWMQGRVAFREM